MDPLSATCAALTIVAALERAHKCIRRLRAMRKAPGEIQDLIEELTDFATTLGQVKDFLSRQALTPPAGQGDAEDSPAQAVFDRLLQRAAGRLQQLADLIPDPDRDRVVGGNRRLIAACKPANFDWVRTRQKAARLLQELRNVQLHLIVALSTCAR